MTNPCMTCGHEKEKHQLNRILYALTQGVEYLCALCPCPSFRPAETGSYIGGTYPIPEPSPEKPNMTLEQKIQAIREKCIAANPEIEEGCDCAICEHEGNHAWRTIRLADVLLAIEGNFATGERTVMMQASGYMHIVVRATIEESKWPDPRKHSEFIAGNGGWLYDIMQISCRWNLRADDLNLQTPETINFLYELLK